MAVTAAFGKAAYKAAYKAAGDYAQTQLDNIVRTQCGGNADGCTAADPWRDGGVYRTALHAAIGGITFGTPGATGNIAGSLALNAMDKVIQSLNITDPTAINTLKNLAVTVAGAGVGGTAGAAAAFNADANNRQLHPTERERIKQLSNGDPILEFKLSAAACYMVRCAAEFVPGTTAYVQLKAIEEAGSGFVAEQTLLSQQKSGSDSLFTYSFWQKSSDSVSRFENRYGRPLTRLGGGLQALGGSATAIAGSSMAATGSIACPETLGAGCLVAAGGYALTLWPQIRCLLV